MYKAPQVYSHAKEHSHLRCCARPCMFEVGIAFPLADAPEQNPSSSASMRPPKKLATQNQRNSSQTAIAGDNSHGKLASALIVCSVLVMVGKICSTHMNCRIRGTRRINNATSTRMLQRLTLCSVILVETPQQALLQCCCSTCLRKRRENGIFLRVLDSPVQCTERAQKTADWVMCEQ